MAFRFTMLNDADTVECQISDAAMDELGGVKGTESMARQAQFLSLRDTVESIASDIFDKGPCVKGQIVRIFTKHVQKLPPSLTDPVATGSEPDASQAASLRIIAETRAAQ
ncbi:DUF1488 family protein [Bradyrhizobium sp. sBnM-33]|uniref:DUF1488 family protein n=1 Tax=Bradyrhizobium sp. sBnM-33 TaxID=2831780 RepID=UPI0020BD56BB|nr:DUF1488 family protein [Bradyrhizobium sp. sBnM-33]WOH54051.1 DUF1488 family protein [Bradyrhizobium sp. sBnM-33]